MCCNWSMLHSCTTSTTHLWLLHSPELGPGKAHKRERLWHGATWLDVHRGTILLQFRLLAQCAVWAALGVSHRRATTHTRATLHFTLT